MSDFETLPIGTRARLERLERAAQQALAFNMRDFASLRDFEAAKAVLHDNLRAALAQQDEPLNLRDPAVQKRLATQWGYVPAAQAEPDVSRCPRCNGPADNGFDRSIPPSPYLCTKCMAEPVEPVAWRTFDGEGGYDYRTYADNENYAAEWAQRNPRHVGWVEPLYTAPPQRKPLTEEEIDGLVIQHAGYGRDNFYAVVRAAIKAAEAGA